MGHRILVVLLYVISSSSVFAQERAAQRFSDIFCDYVNIFVGQIVLQEERNVPFSRLDVFNYFSAEQGEFLRETAVEIYLGSSDEGGALDEFFVTQTQQECRARFDGDTDE